MSRSSLAGFTRFEAQFCHAKYFRRATVTPQSRDREHATHAVRTWPLERTSCGPRQLTMRTAPESPALLSSVVRRRRTLAEMHQGLITRKWHCKNMVDRACCAVVDRRDSDHLASCTRISSRCMERACLGTSCELNNVGFRSCHGRIWMKGSLLAAVFPLGRLRIYPNQDDRVNDYTVYAGCLIAAAHRPYGSLGVQPVSGSGEPGACRGITPVLASAT